MLFPTISKPLTARLRRSIRITSALWHLPKPIAQLQRDNGSYQDSRCWDWIEAGWTGAISDQWSLSRGLTLHGWNAEHGRQAEVMPKDIAHTAHSFCASFHEGEALAQSQTDALIAASWAERGCPGSHQTAYQDISPWVTAIDARQKIFATSAKP